jgi:hypothetical protein
MSKPGVDITPPSNPGQRANRFGSRKLVAAAVLGLAILGGTFLVLAVFRIASEPLRITAFGMDVYRLHEGKQVFLTRLHPGPHFQAHFQQDAVRVWAQFDKPGYAYLIAINPSGREQLCFPADAGSAPEAHTAVEYPAKDEVPFPLNDGVNVHVFVLLVSNRPLPAYDEWRTAHVLPRSPQQEAGWYSYDGTRVSHITGERGTAAPVQLVGGGIADLQHYLEQAPEIEAAYCLAFPVIHVVNR